MQEDAARAEMGAAGSATPMLNAHGHGAAVYRPEDSVYYHPQLNPEGKPPPGKPQRYRSVPQLEAAPRAPGDQSERLKSNQTHLDGALYAAPFLVLLLG